MLTGIIWWGRKGSTAGCRLQPLAGQRGFSLALLFQNCSSHLLPFLPMHPHLLLSCIPFPMCFPHLSEFHLPLCFLPLCLFSPLHLCQAALILLCQSIYKGSGGHSTGRFPAVSSPVWLHGAPKQTGEKTAGRMIARNISLGPLALGCCVETA